MELLPFVILMDIFIFQRIFCFLNVINGISSNLANTYIILDKYL